MKNNFIVFVNYSCYLEPIFFTTNLDNLKIGDFVLIKTIRGNEIGIIISEPKNILLKDKNLSSIIRKANDNEINIYRDEKKKEKEIFNFINNLKLSIRPLFIEYIFNTDNVILIYTSEKKYDYTNFIKKINDHFKIKIILQQIDNIDRVRMLNSFGICGRKVCCLNFLNKKNNHLTKIHNNKLIGLCDNIKCCLNFEKND